MATVGVLAFLLVVTIRIAIHPASSDFVRSDLAIGVLGLAVLANPVAWIDVGGGGNKVPGSDESDTMVMEFPRAALAEPHVGGLWRPTKTTLVAGDFLALRGGYVRSL